ncbi:hypothetical protein D8674_013264 [Pyrus ussuriensis x Pyrus communis]|uniref:Uncharacterized protein n=1 Tax=Pyrus ussuriensis x Pyrus communis TaxID=2448454 RepID=A0A5N5GP93_9ROSA|nr:hypothetical protein D8674_013264 [Pyrus ussuriensis x Pyrus communis]
MTEIQKTNLPILSRLAGEVVELEVCEEVESSSDFEAIPKEFVDSRIPYEDLSAVGASKAIDVMTISEM